MDVNKHLHSSTLQNKAVFLAGANLTSGAQVPSANAYPGSCDSYKPVPLNIESKSAANPFENAWEWRV